MKIIIENIGLHDKPSQRGLSYEGETLTGILQWLDLSEGLDLGKLNIRLAELGVKPLTLSDIKIVGIEK